MSSAGLPRNVVINHDNRVGAEHRLAFSPNGPRLGFRQPPHVVLGRLVRLQGLIDVSRPRGKLDPGVRENLLPPRRRGRESDEEIGRYRADLEEILTYVEKLNELDTSNVEPMAQVIARRRESPDANGNSEGMLKVRSRLDAVSLQDRRKGRVRI